jgi:CheY-like chemotaxis protein
VGVRKIVLVVNEDERCREALCSFLRGDGYDTWGVSTGLEALEVARRWKPAAIIMDIETPALNGWALLDALDADPELSVIPRFVLSPQDATALRDSVTPEEDVFEAWPQEEATRSFLH